MAEEMAHVFVSGRVQGVYYRAFTNDLALRLGLKGWCRNLPDGRVEMVFEGDRDVIALAISECRRGPSGSLVENMDTEWSPATGEFRGFKIKY